MEDSLDGLELEDGICDSLDDLVLACDGLTLEEGGVYAGLDGLIYEVGVHLDGLS